MAGAKHRIVRPSDKKQSWNFTKLVNTYCSREFIVDLLTDPRYTMYIGWTLLLIEFCLNLVIVHRVPYTEIDWNAYMQECEGFLNGTLDYTLLKGDTGPLVYPAGFLYLYSALYYLTSNGSNIKLAQYIFVALYLVQLYLTLRIYARTRKIPPYALILVTLTSYRIHSIYALRLFNDPWAVVLFYGALNAFLAGKWYLGSILYSLAVSIKMNILLYAPCLLAAYIGCCGGVRGALKHIGCCALVQLLLGAPFLWTNFWGYIEGSFDVRRIFEHKWTVNWRFLDRQLFENRYLHVGLLVVHLAVLVTFLPAIWRYLTSYAKLKQIETQICPQLDTNDDNTKTTQKKSSLVARQRKKEASGLPRDQQKFLDAYEGALKKRVEDDVNFTVDFSSSAQLFVLPMFVTNFIGMACARSLHYQFYAWYYHSLLYLTWCTQLPRPVVFLLLGVIECCWNTYPSTNLSSGALHLCHLIIIVGVFRAMRRSAGKTNN